MAVADWVAVLTATDGYDLSAPVPSGALDHVEERLGASLPSGLRALYEVTDGVLDKPGEWQVIWNVEELSRRNLVAYGTEEPPRHELIAFGDDGTGNPFCVRCDGGEAVYYWSPIDQEATWLAADLTDFWTRWTTNRLPTH